MGLCYGRENLKVCYYVFLADLAHYCYQQMHISCCYLLELSSDNTLYLAQYFSLLFSL